MKSVFYGIETLNKKDMTNEEKLSKALQDFKTKYPSVTSADLQTFIIGWQEAVKNCVIPAVSKSLKCDCKHSGSCRYEEVILETKELCRHKE